MEAKCTRSIAAYAPQKKIDDAQLTRLNVERGLYGDMTMAGTERMDSEAGENLKKLVETPVSLGPSPRGFGGIDGETLADRAREKLAESVGGRFDGLVGLGEAKAKAKAEAKVDDPPDIEALAAAEHESWSGWHKYERRTVSQQIADLDLPISERNAIHKAILGLPCWQRWKRQSETPYDQLPSEERESDRVEARKKLKVYRPKGG